jgi:ACR3 family arsenite transporter
MEHQPRETGEYGAGLIALNSFFKYCYTAFMLTFFITILPPYFGYTGFEVNISMGQIAQSVGIYLGILCTRNH